MSRNEALQFINVAHFFDHFFLLIFPTAALAIAPAWGMSFADVLLFGTLLYVMFAAIYHPVGLAHVTQIGLRSGRALAINGVFGNMGLAGAAITTGLLAQFFGWQSAFALPGVISFVIGGVLIVRNRKNRNLTALNTETEKRTMTPHSRQTQWTVFLVICISALFGGMVFNMVTISLPKFLDERLLTE